MRPDCRRRGAPPGEVRLAKARRGVQPRPARQVKANKGKAAGRTRRLLETAASRVRESAAAAARYALLRLPRAAFGSHRAAIGPVIAAMHPAAHPVLAALAAFAAEFVSAEPGERVEAMLLALVQALRADRPRRPVS